jgi:hypothetical protein
MQVKACNYEMDIYTFSTKYETGGKSARIEVWLSDFYTPSRKMRIVSFEEATKCVFRLLYTSLQPGISIAWGAKQNCFLLFMSQSKPSSFWLLGEYSKTEREQRSEGKNTMKMHRAVAARRGA